MKEKGENLFISVLMMWHEWETSKFAASTPSSHSFVLSPHMKHLGKCGITFTRRTWTPSQLPAQWWGHQSLRESLWNARIRVVLREMLRGMEWGLEERSVDGRQEWNGGSKQRKMETEGLKKEQKRRGRWLRDLPDLHHTPGSLLMPSTSSSDGDSLLCFTIWMEGVGKWVDGGWVLDKRRISNETEQGRLLCAEILISYRWPCEGLFWRDFWQGGSVLLIYEQRYASIWLMDEQRLGSELLCSSRLSQDFVGFHDPRISFSPAKTTQSATWMQLLNSTHCIVLLWVTCIVGWLQLV